MSLTCAFYYPCDVNISTEWFMSASDELTTNGESIRILEDDKYRVTQPRNGTINNNFCWMLFWNFQFIYMSIQSQ